MSNYWTPSGVAVSVTATVANQLVITASNQLESLVRFVNSGTTLAFCAMVSAGASVGDAVNAVPVLGPSVFWIASTARTPVAYVSGASAVFAQAGYALK